MAERLLRTQILLEPEQHQELTEIAQREQRSLSDIVRTLLQQQLDLRKQNQEERKRQRHADLQTIHRNRQTIIAQHGNQPLDIDPVELIDQMREERDAELLAGLYASRD